jgi:elongation factor P
MVLRIDQQISRVISVEFHTGAAKMEGTVQATLANVRTGRLWDQCFRLHERLEDVELGECTVEFLYRDGSNCIFERLDSSEQVEFSSSSLGLDEQPPLHSGTKFPAELFEGELVNIVLRDTVDARVMSILTDARLQQESGRHKAILENGMTVQVPSSVSPGEIIRVDRMSGRYVERVRLQQKKGIRKRRPG